MCDLLNSSDVLNTIRTRGPSIFLHNMLYFSIPLTKKQGFLSPVPVLPLSILLLREDPAGSWPCAGQTVFSSISQYSRDGRTAALPAPVSRAISPGGNIEDIPADDPENSQIPRKHRYAERLAQVWIWHLTMIIAGSSPPVRI